MRKFVTVFFIVILFLPIFADSNQWSSLKLIYYFDSHGMRDEVIKQLDEMNLNLLSGNERERIIYKLISFADSRIKTDKALSKTVYLKIIDEAPDFWYVKNKLVSLDSPDGLIFYDFKATLSQLIKIWMDFSSSFLMLNIFVNSFLYSLLFVIFLFAVVVLIKYFTLFTNDVLIDDSVGFSLKNTVILTAFFIWPIVFLAGWVIYPLLVLGILFKYLSNSEKKSIYLLLVISVVVLFMYSFINILTEHYNSETFKIDRELFKGVYREKDYSSLIGEQKTVYAYLQYKKGNFAKAREILETINDEKYGELKTLLLGNLYYQKYKNSDEMNDDDLSKSMNFFAKVLRKNENNQVALNNLALVLFRNIANDNSEKVFESYEQRYPRLNMMKKEVLELKEPLLDRNYLWKRLIKLSKASFEPVKLLTDTSLRFFSLPFIYYILVFYIYVKFLNRFFETIGESTICSKCSKIIKKKNIHKSYNLCEDCHQLFLIKDVIFLEAKLLKEKEIKKKNLIGFAKIMIASIFIPGLNFNFKERNRTYILLSIFLFFFFVFAVTGIIGFSALKLPVPFIFNISGIIATVLYFVINIVSVSGEDYGI